MILSLSKYAHKNVTEACEKLQQYFINDDIDVINPWLGVADSQEVTAKVSSLPKHTFRWNSKNGIWHGYSIWYGLTNYEI